MKIEKLLITQSKDILAVSAKEAYWYQNISVKNKETRNHGDTNWDYRDQLTEKTAEYNSNLNKEVQRFTEK